MKKIFIITICLLLAGCTQVIKMGEAVEISGIERVTAPENNTYKIGVKNFQEEFKNDITDSRPLQYKLDDKFISFKPIRMYFDGLTASSKPAQITLKTADKEYKEVFGKGIDLKMNTGGRVWEKLITINSLKDLGTIPPIAENLIIEFEIETNFVIDGWDRKTDLEIIDKIRLGDYSYLEQASVWDSYREEICIDPKDEMTCEILTNRIELKTFLKNKNGTLIFEKQIPIQWLKTALYPIWTDADIEYGTPVVFDNVYVARTRIAELDTNKFVICWTESGGGFLDGECRAATVSGTTISYGGASIFDGGNYSQYMDVCKLDTDKFMVVWARETDSDGYARVASTTGNTINDWGDEIEFETGDTEDISCAQIDTGKIVACYNDEDNSDTGKCCVMTVPSGDSSTITPGTPTAHDGGTTDYYTKWNSVAKLDTDKFINCFEMEDAPDDGICFAATVSTRDITFGSEATFDTDNPNHTALTSPDTNKFVLTYVDETNSIGEVIAGSVSDKTITFGTTENADDGETANVSITSIDTTHIVMAFEDEDDSSKGKSNYSTVNFGDNSIVISTPDIFHNASTGGDYTTAIDVELISSNKIVICYRDEDAANDPGECIIGDIGAVAAYSTPDAQFKSGSNRILNNTKIKGH